MIFLTSFTANLLRLTRLIELRKIDPGHMRLWFEYIGMRPPAIEDPSSAERLREMIVELNTQIALFVSVILRDHLEVERGSSASITQRASIGQIRLAIDRLLNAASLRQSQGDEGWVYICIQLLEGAVSGHVTPDSIDTLLRSLNAPTQTATTIDA